MMAVMMINYHDVDDHRYITIITVIDDADDDNGDDVDDGGADR